MSWEELRSLPTVVKLDVANRAFGLSRSKGYELAKLDDYPCRVLRVGRAYRVVTADMVRILSAADAVPMAPGDGAAGASLRSLDGRKPGLRAA
ncbi:hypothetical protein ACPA54_12995 [Uniformispora flossi]|uniref:hypothetical protein n=1 Tax=Uniformispora flossi TaxID=3390723 RepID=UPI003C2E8981